MKIVKTGEISRIFPDDLQTFDKLPVGNYKVCFHPMMGFYLEDADAFNTSEKSYGKHPEKIQKVINLYNNIDRSVGVLFSGKKGMGKSMSARLLSTRFAEEHNMPTIIVSDPFLGVVDFIESIKQEVVVLFDEFEKVFDSGENMFQGKQVEKPSNKDTQEKMLGLFDGVSQTKRLYVVSVNDIKKVNQFMVNRPGRFHYHLQFGYPTHDEIELYLKDKLNPEFYNQIPFVQRFSTRCALNYDSLRAISFDLNLGYSFLETMEDLNISSSENEAISYNVSIHHFNGMIVTTEASVDLMSTSSKVNYKKGLEYMTIEFSPLAVEVDSFNKSFTLMVGVTPFEERSSKDYWEEDDFEEGKEPTVEKIVFTKREIGGTRFGKEFEQKFMA